jgi:hypothetical protein
MNGKRKCDTFTQWNTTQPIKNKINTIMDGT